MKRIVELLKSGKLDLDSLDWQDRDYLSWILDMGQASINQASPQSPLSNIEGEYNFLLRETGETTSP